MAVVTRVKARPCMPVGYEVVSPAATVSVACVAGDLMEKVSGVWQLSTAANPTRKRGFAAQNYYAGQKDCSIIHHGEMDGWSGLIDGDPLYPAAAGALETVAVVGFVGLIHAVSTTRIQFTL